MFADYFKESYVDSSNVGSDYPYFIPSFTIFSHITLTETDVLNGLRSLPVNYCPGPDGIPSFILKECADILYIRLTRLFNLSLRDGSFPDIWKISYVIPLFKKGSRSDIGNYRCILS
ncbi:uncharacterized protein LOC142239728 [Haematobia irritans]|uniref:uncharacterized protein LOC142239728 n=1 Tax=Haematobia irritans TaxID=7368 RepID=UPI003F4FB13B